MTLAMECPHLCDIEKIQTANLRVLLENAKAESKSNSRRTSANVQHQCQVCKSHRSPWMCAICGLVHCGRYVNSHAKAHFEGNNRHFLALCCQSRSAFCYACDDYVINENQSKRIQTMLDQLAKDEEPEKPIKRKDTQRLSTNDRISQNSKVIVKGKRFKLSGLRNLGNTCYMNSVIQCLGNIHLFTSSVRDSFPNTEETTIRSVAQKRKVLSLAHNQTKSELLYETIRETIMLLRESGKSTIIPESLFSMLCKVPRFRGYQQQDAHEFLRYVLDRLHQESLDNCPVPEKRANMLFTTIEGRKSSVISNIFGGILQNEVNCLECGFKSHKLDPFLDLSLDIPGQRVSSYDTTSSDSNSSYTGSIEDCHLMDCLSSFIELEELTETELYYCSNCQQKQRSTKRFWIRRLPDVLCLHLKRFRWNNYIRTKIDSYIEFPMEKLDMKRFVMANKHETRGSSLGPTTYDLSAFIEHHGTGTGSGHYTAYANHDGNWFHFDDSSVNSCEESSVRQAKAYILFYNRRAN